MSQKGKQSVAHVYDKSGACIYCGMYESNVKLLSHNCTPARELWADAQVAKMMAELKEKAESHG